MTRKTLIALLIIFILSACGSNYGSIQVTPTLVSTAISTFTPEPTVTHTPIPTETPFQYTSCLDPELIEEIKTGFTEQFKMSVNDYIDKIVALGKYNKAFYILSQDNKTQADYVLMGGAEISLANLTSADKNDLAFCLYFVDDSDTTTLVPMIISYTYQGNFYRTSYVYEGIHTGAAPVALNSMVELRKWWDSGSNKPKIGDVFVIPYHSFEGTTTPEQVAELESTKVSSPNEVARLLKILSNGYLQRIGGIGSPVQAVKELKFDLGDIGLFPYYVGLEERNPLGN